MRFTNEEIAERRARLEAIASERGSPVTWVERMLEAITGQGTASPSNDAAPAVDIIAVDTVDTVDTVAVDTEVDEVLAFLRTTPAPDAKRDLESAPASTASEHRGRPLGSSRVDPKVLVELLKSGLTMRAIGDKLGVHRTTVQYACKSNKIDVEALRPPPAARAPTPSATKTPRAPTSKVDATRKRARSAKAPAESPMTLELFERTEGRGPRQHAAEDARADGLADAADGVRKIHYRDIAGEEETRLIVAFQKGDRKAGDTLVRAHSPLIWHQVHKYRWSPLDPKDLYQEACIGFLKGLKKFDPERGYKSSTYVNWWLRHAVSRAHEDMSGNVRLPVHVRSKLRKIRKLGLTSADEILDAGIAKAKSFAVALAEPARSFSANKKMTEDEDAKEFQDALASDAAGPDELVETEQRQAYLRERLDALMAGLPPIQLDILRRRARADDDDEMTLKEVGDRHGLSRERIRQLEEVALSALRARIALLPARERRELMDLPDSSRRSSRRSGGDAPAGRPPLAETKPIEPHPPCAPSAPAPPAPARARGRPRSFDRDAVIRNARAYLAAGDTLTDAARKLGLSGSYLTELCRRHGITRPPGRPPGRKKSDPTRLLDQVKPLLARGMSVKAAAHEVGVSAARLSGLCAEHGIVRAKLPVASPRSKERPPAEQPLPPGVSTNVPRRSLPLVRQRAQSSYVVYRGPSAFDGSLIVGVVTNVSTNVTNGAASNEKLGQMAQLHILVADQAPNVAKRTGRDAAVCGDCKLRQGSNGITCYVNVAFSTTTLWKAHAWRPVELEACAEALTRTGVHLRVGAYGDPGALPKAVVEQLVAAAHGATGYTHDWRHERSAWLRRFAMASVETADDAVRARAEGWRTYRIVRSAETSSLPADEILCPNVTHHTHCADCGLCNGSRGNEDARKMIAIPAHGRGRVAEVAEARPAPPGAQEGRCAYCGDTVYSTSPIRKPPVFCRPPKPCLARGAQARQKLRASLSPLRSDVSRELSSSFVETVKEAGRAGLDAVRTADPMALDIAGATLTVSNNGRARVIRTPSGRELSHEQLLAGLMKRQAVSTQRP